MGHQLSSQGGIQPQTVGFALIFGIPEITRLQESLNLTPKRLFFLFFIPQICEQYSANVRE